MISYITLPSTAPADVLASTGTIFTDLWVLLALAIGLPLAFFIINLIVDIVSGRQETQYTKDELEDAARGVPK
jgi:hypothetical protein